MNPNEGIGSSPQTARRGPITTMWQDPKDSLPFYKDLLRRLERAKRAAAALRNGQGVLVADDGSRENEVDFVFHAASATPELVNVALRHCRGLLCVSMSGARADALGLLTAPKTAAEMALTGFTLSLDARTGIGSGISASDRAHTIALMAKNGARSVDFVTPGHVFPVRAAEGLLCRRTGHTEAVLELCRLGNLSEVAAMCECLGDDGQALSVATFEEGNLPQEHPLSGFAFVSTIDLLWARLLTQPLTLPDWPLGAGMARPDLLVQGVSDTPWCLFPPCHLAEIGAVMFPYSLWINQKQWQAGNQTVQVDWLGNPPETVLGLGKASRIDHGLQEDQAAVHVSIFAPGALPAQPGHNPEVSHGHADITNVAELCDLSAKEGLGACAPAARRLLTTLALAEALATMGASAKDDVAQGHGDWFLKLAHPADRPLAQAIVEARKIFAR